MEGGLPYKGYVGTYSVRGYAKLDLRSRPAGLVLFSVL